MRRAAKIDANQPEIVETLRAYGCAVQSLAAIGRGCPDLLAWSPWVGAQLLEVKDGSKPPSARRLTPDQVEYHAKWKGPIHIVTTPEEALTVMGVKCSTA